MIVDLSMASLTNLLICIDTFKDYLFPGTILEAPYWSTDTWTNNAKGMAKLFHLNAFILCYSSLLLEWLLFPVFTAILHIHNLHNVPLTVLFIQNMWQLMSSLTDGHQI